MNRVLIPVLIAFSVVADVCAIETHEVIGPTDAGGRYKHPTTFTQLDNGDLYLAFYGGSGEYSTDTAVSGSRLEAGSAQWSAPKVIADTPFVSEGNPVVWQAPDGIVWLFYVVRYGETWSTSRIQAKISRDGA
ncbi:MAG: exo-alpha-sialidase, partial [Pseudomonadales bacterium]